MRVCNKPLRWNPLWILRGSLMMCQSWEQEGWSLRTHWGPVIIKCSREKKCFSLQITEIAVDDLGDIITVKPETDDQEET